MNDACQKTLSDEENAGYRMAISRIRAGDLQRAMIAAGFSQTAKNITEDLERLEAMIVRIRRYRGKKANEANYRAGVTALMHAFLALQAIERKGSDRDWMDNALLAIRDLAWWVGWLSGKLGSRTGRPQIRQGDSRIIQEICREFAATPGNAKFKFNGCAGCCSRRVKPVGCIL